MNSKKIILIYLILAISIPTYAEVNVKCNKNINLSNPSSEITSLDQNIEKIIKPKSKWSANQLSKKECDNILKQIEKAKITSAMIPELLSSIDVIKAECGIGPDPLVVVKDVMPFIIQNTNLFLEWNEAGKLSIKTNNKIDEYDYIVEYSKKDLESSPLVLSEDQQKMLDSKEADLKEISDKSADKKGMVGRWWGSVKDNIKTIAKEGTTEVYLPVIAYHDRSTYTPDKVAQLNEAAVGVGIGKSLKNKKGNTEMVYAMVHLDSHAQVELNVGYGWLKNFQISENTTVGIGYSAGVISRKDINNHIPLPFILPMASVEYGKKFSVNGVLIPKLNGGINHGNVVFLFGKYEFDK